MLDRVEEEATVEAQRLDDGLDCTPSATLDKGMLG
jgi:hypothetical protein